MRRHFTRITKFDVFTAISLIALFFVILSGIIAPKSEGELDEVIITVRAEGVSTALAEELSGAELFWLEDKYELTSVSAVTDEARILISSGGMLYEAKSLTKKTVTLTLSAKGTHSEAGFLIGKIRFLAPNMDVKIASLSTEVSVKILSIDKNAPTFGE